MWLEVKVNWLQQKISRWTRLDYLTIKLAGGNVRRPGPVVFVLLCRKGGISLLSVWWRSGKFSVSMVFVNKLRSWASIICRLTFKDLHPWEKSSKVHLLAFSQWKIKDHINSKNQRLCLKRDWRYHFPSYTASCYHVTKVHRMNRELQEWVLKPGYKITWRIRNFSWAYLLLNWNYPICFLWRELGWWLAYRNTSSMYHSVHPEGNMDVPNAMTIQLIDVEIAEDKNKNVSLMVVLEEKIRGLSKW